MHGQAHIALPRLLNKALNNHILTARSIQRDLNRYFDEGMQEFKFFPKRMLSLVKVGEEVNQLDVMLAKVSNQYREEMKHRTAILGKLMEPILLLLVAGIVGVILIAMYLPMFNLSNVLGQ